MIQFLKYLKGYLRIKVSGFSPERFMNLCSAHNILLWGITQKQGAYEMYISLKGFYQLRSIVRKTGTKVAILKRRGLPFFVPQLLSKKIFILGLLLSVGFWIASTFFIWKIELSGNYRITEDLFLTFLEEYDIRIGILKTKIELAELEKQIRSHFTEVTWTSTKIEGTRLLIAIKENDAPILTTEENTDSMGQDLISPYEGVVVSMIVRSGIPKVKIGDSVTMDQVLVSGQIPILNDDATIRQIDTVIADADVIVEHHMEHRETLPYDYTEKEYTGRSKKRYFIRFGQKELRSILEIPYRYYDSVLDEKKPGVLEDLKIPLLWGTYTYREYQVVEHEYSLEQAQEILQKKMEIFLADLAQKKVQIIDKNVRIDTIGGEWVIIGQLLVHEKVNTLRDIPAESFTQEGVN
ncbi:MAG: sporulation protein YqfD [Lachnospiraceae bacterium]|jgi:similar to stage IV sporulation protein|nr:sporulation protein YqfD [Lachnospiraceae bacterium]